MMECEFSWCCDESAVPDLVSFFVKHVDTTYISHGEIQCGRADFLDRWSADFPTVLADEFTGAVRDTTNGKPSRLVAWRRDGMHIVALAVVGFDFSSSRPYAVTEDLVVASHARGFGVGGRFLSWIESEARRLGANRLFLESGINNAAAHRFFERHGYLEASKVFTKRL